MTDELMKHLNEGRAILVSELEDDGPFVLTIAPRIGIPVTESRIPEDTLRTPPIEEVA